MLQYSIVHSLCWGTWSSTWRDQSIDPQLFKNIKFQFQCFLIGMLVKNGYNSENSNSKFCIPFHKTCGFHIASSYLFHRIQRNFIGIQINRYMNISPFTPGLIRKHLCKLHSANIWQHWPLGYIHYTEEQLVKAMLQAKIKVYVLLTILLKYLFYNLTWSIKTHS